ncbi:MAG: helix-turn-helix domain-containing protein [Cyclobacteriaceae bacterium]
MKSKNIIMIDEEDLEELIAKLLDRMIILYKPETRKWIDTEEAMKHLGITSSTTLQKYRDEGRIRFSQPSKRIILYDRESLDEFLDQNARDTF